MKKTPDLLRKINLIFGFLAVGALVYVLFVLLRLQPKMIQFSALSDLESNLLTGVGFGLLILLGFMLFSLLQISRFIKHREKIGAFPLVLVVSGVLALLFVFSDIAFLSDIHNQYLDQLSQPEWGMVFPFIIFQFVITLLFVYLHLTGYFQSKQVDRVVSDVNIYLVVQIVGLISGGIGLVMASLGFYFPTGWSLPVHTVIAGLTILFPYALAVFYWGITQIKERSEVWWDEKQGQDMGKSALLTLGVETVLLLLLFTFNFGDLAGVVRMLWLPIYIFSVVFVFSLGNLFFSSRG